MCCDVLRTLHATRIVVFSVCETVHTYGQKNGPVLVSGTPLYDCTCLEELIIKTHPVSIELHEVLNTN